MPILTPPRVDLCNIDFMLFSRYQIYLVARQILIMKAIEVYQLMLSIFIRESVIMSAPANRSSSTVPLP